MRRIFSITYGQNEQGLEIRSRYAHTIKEETTTQGSIKTLPKASALSIILNTFLFRNKTITTLVSSISLTTKDLK